jgi:hypothetical protein
VAPSTAVDAAWGFGCVRTTAKRVFLEFFIALKRSSLGHMAYLMSQAELQKVANDFEANSYGDKATY